MLQHKLCENKKIPKCWLTVSIGEISNVVSGGTPRANNPLNFSAPNTGIAWLTPADLSGYTEKYISHGARDLSQLGYESSSAKLIPAGSLLFSSRAPIGYVAIASNEVSTSQGFKSFIFPYYVDSNYAYYYLLSIRDLAESFGTGTTFKEISSTVAKTLPFILPPLDEQKIIADKLDVFFEKVEATKNNLEHTLNLLKYFRQSVLLTETNKKLKRDHKSHLELHEVSLGSILEFAYGKALPAKSRNGVKYPVYGSNGEIGRHKEKLVEGPFIIVGRKGSCGEVTWSSDSGWPIDTAYYVVLKKDVDLKFIFFLLQTLGLNQLNRSTAIPSLNRNDAYELKVKLPSFGEQKKIVHRIEESFAVADSIEQEINIALERVNNLFQSTLVKALQGDLTADWREANPELISGENSAEALLRKIKIERKKLENYSKVKSRTITKKKAGKSMGSKIITVTEALRKANKPLSGQQLLNKAGYPNDSTIEELEKYFLDIREALVQNEIVQLERDKDQQDWFALAETTI